MRSVFRVAGALFGVLLILVLLTGIVTFIRKSWFAKDPAGKPHVAVVDLVGPIYSASGFLTKLKRHVDNTSTKAIVVRVNSPGGLVAPSQEIYDAILRADAKKPVIISMGAVAASGGYYVALGGRKIIANPGTLTASIGVIMEFANTQKLLSWAKIDRFSIKSGKFKDIGTPFRPMRPDEEALLTSLVQDIYRQFRGVVKERRKLSDGELDQIADGRIVSGNQAKAAKLIDELGGIDDAIKQAKAMGSLPETAEVVYPEAGAGILKRLFGDEDEPASELSRLVGQVVGPSESGFRVMLRAPLVD